LSVLGFLPLQTSALVLPPVFVFDAPFLPTTLDSREFLFFPAVVFPAPPSFAAEHVEPPVAWANTSPASENILTIANSIPNLFMEHPPLIGEAFKVVLRASQLAQQLARYF
jgi:hypothetical protein